MGAPGPNRVPAFGVIYATGASTAQSSIGTSYAKLTGFATAGGVSVNCVEDISSDQLTVRLPGSYAVDFHGSFSAATASTTYTLAISVNGTESAFKTAVKTTASAAEDFVASCCGILDLDGDDDVYIEVKADGSTKSLTPAELQLRVMRIA